MRRQGLPIVIETRPAHSPQQKLGSISKSSFQALQTPTDPCNNCWPRQTKN
jgi:hypothetical protein